MDERNYWLSFSIFPGIGPVTFKKLLDTFGSAKEAWNLPRSELSKFIQKRYLEKFVDFRNSFPFEGYLAELKRKEVWFLTLADKEYPELLKQIKKPPFVLYGRGDLNVLYSSSERSELRSSKGESSRQARTIMPMIAVVGTRKITEYGRQVTEMFATDLVQNGFTIVSGLALGVDAVAHATAIENNGLTIAVLGCGVDCCTPSENQNLYDEIIKKNGAIISEFPLNHPPTIGSFPSRNRIIAGLSEGVLVTEGAEDSGSLITAECALSEGRSVFAVPGPITSGMSKGPFKLIQKGAKLVTSAEEIVQSITSTTGITGITSITGSRKSSESRRSRKGDTKEEKKILEVLENEVLHFDAIVRKTGFPSSKLGSLLTLMEMKGMVKNAEGTFRITA